MIDLVARREDIHKMRMFIDNELCPPIKGVLDLGTAIVPKEARMVANDTLRRIISDDLEAAFFGLNMLGRKLGPHARTSFMRKLKDLDLLPKGWEGELKGVEFP